MYQFETYINGFLDLEYPNFDPKRGFLSTVDFGYSGHGYSGHWDIVATMAGTESFPIISILN